MRHTSKPSWKLGVSRATEAPQAYRTLGVNTLVPCLSTLKYIAAYRLWLQFADGTQGEVNLAPELWGEMFELLRDQTSFQTVQLDKELNTIRWANGTDFAPEFLYQLVTKGSKTPAQ